MKTLKIKSIKRISTLLVATFLSLTGFSKEHVTMSLKNITTTFNTIEYDLYIVNDGNTALKLSACSYGVNFNESILNGGAITYSYRENSRGVALSGLTSFSVATTKVGEIHQARMTSMPSQYENAAELISNIPFKVGRFKIINSVPWTQNSHPAFALQETSKIGLTVTQLVGYVGTNSNLVALTPTLKTVTTTVENSPLLNTTQQNSNASSQSNIAQEDQKNQLFTNEVSINIYPNPVTDELKVDLNAVGKTAVIIKIADMHGRLVKHIQTDVVDGLNKLSIDVSALAYGMYSIKVSDDNELNYSHAFTKQ